MPLEAFEVTAGRTVKEDLLTLGRPYLSSSSFMMYPTSASDGRTIQSIQKEMLSRSGGMEHPKVSFWKRSFLSRAVLGLTTESVKYHPYRRRFRFYFCSDTEQATRTTGTVEVDAWVGRRSAALINEGAVYTPLHRSHVIHWNGSREEIPAAYGGQHGVYGETTVLLDMGNAGAMLQQDGTAPLHGRIILCTGVVPVDEPDFYIPFDETDIPEDKLATYEESADGESEDVELTEGVSEGGSSDMLVSLEDDFSCEEFVLESGRSKEC